MTYKSLLPHQQRVVDEKAELDEKLSKLAKFLACVTSETVDAAEIKRLREQSRYMAEYSRVLGERIAAFQMEKLA